jgi:hypothetical protein
MKNIYITFELFDEDEKEITFELLYKKKSYLIFVPNDGEFHNKLWECEEEIPEELVFFVDTVIRRELNKRNDAK